jgi:hypothetical protein
MEFNYEKFKNLVHYIAYAADRSDLGATKLNKSLWYADIMAYLLTGQAITGEIYIKQQYGPVPKHVLQAVEELQVEGKIYVRDAAFFGYRKKEYIALKSPEVSSFTAREMAIIDQVVEHVCRGHTARSISDLTHDDAWKLAEIGEELPYYTIYAAHAGELDEEDVAWAKASIQEMGASG